MQRRGEEGPEIWMEENSNGGRSGMGEVDGFG